MTEIHVRYDLPFEINHFLDRPDAAFLTVPMTYLTKWCPSDGISPINISSLKVAYTM